MKVKYKGHCSHLVFGVVITIERNALSTNKFYQIMLIMGRNF